MNQFDNDIPKHIKKKNSSTSKSSVKSKHKHEYVDCLLIKNGHPHKAEYCKFCGKINDLHFFETERTVNGMRRCLENNEVFEKYKDLEQFVVDDVFQKYVVLTENN